MMDHNLEQRLTRIESKIDDVRSELSDIRANGVKTATRANGLADRVSMIENHIPACEARFQNIEKNANAWTGRMIGFGVAFTALLSLVSVLIALWRLV